MPRFEVESKQTREAHEEHFAEYTAWLRDNETMSVHVFTGPTRESVKAQAVQKSREIKPAPSEDFAFVCGWSSLGQLGSVI